MMKENSPICASPIPTRSEVRMSLLVIKASERAADNLAQDDDDRDGNNGERILCEERGVDKHADGNEKYRAEEISHGVHERFDLIDLASFGDDGSDDEGAQRNTVTEFHGDDEIPKQRPTTVIKSISSLLKRAT